MNEEKKYPARVILGCVKETKWGWSGKLGMSNITVSRGKKDPSMLVIYLQERVEQENRGYAPQQPQRPQPPPRQQYAPPQPQAPPDYEVGDPGPSDDDLGF